MKKLTMLLIVLLVVLLPVLGVDAAKKKTTTTTTVAGKKVNFYLFYGSTCPHCQEMHEYLAELEKDPTINYMFEIKEYEVWNDKENNSFMMEIAEELGYGEEIRNQKFGVPFYIIGEYHTTGYSTSANSKIREEIEKAYKNKDTLDLVASIEDGTLVGDRKASESKKNRTVGYVILGVTAIIVIAILFSKNNNTYYDDEDEDDDDEEMDEESEVKKTTTKNTTTKKKTNTKKKN